MVWFPLIVTAPAVEVKFAAPVVDQAFGRVNAFGTEIDAFEIGTDEFIFAVERAAEGGLKVDHVAQEDVFGQKFVAPDDDGLEGERAFAEACDHRLAAGLDALGDRDLALARQKLHRAHLAQVHAHGVVGALGRLGAGGGGGGSNGTRGSGGSGGGGSGGDPNNTTAGNGVANTGSGGGGATYNGSALPGGNGGSGLIIFRFTAVVNPAVINAPATSGAIYKGVTTTVSVTMDSPGVVRFFANNKTIGKCVSVLTTGSSPTYSASCNWKPTTSGNQQIKAQLTPSNGAQSAQTSATRSVQVLRRTTIR